MLTDWETEDGGRVGKSEAITVDTSLSVKGRLEGMCHRKNLHGSVVREDSLFGQLELLEFGRFENLLWFYI